MQDSRHNYIQIEFEIIRLNGWYRMAIPRCIIFRVCMLQDNALQKDGNKRERRIRVDKRYEI